MPQLNAYLSFDGNCAEAMKFYARVLGAKLEALISYGQVPGDQPTPASHADRIMHAYLVHPDFVLMAGDMPPGIAYQGVNGVMMTLTYPTAAEGRRVFEALADGGSVTMPLGETFWAESSAWSPTASAMPWGINGGSKPRPDVCCSRIHAVAKAASKCARLSAIPRSHRGVRDVQLDPMLPSHLCATACATASVARAGEYFEKDGVAVRGHDVVRTSRKASR